MKAVKLVKRQDDKRRRLVVKKKKKKLTQDLYPSHPPGHLRLSYQRGIINFLLQKLLSGLLPVDNQSDLPIDSVQDRSRIAEL